MWTEAHTPGMHADARTHDASRHKTFDMCIVTLRTTLETTTLETTTLETTTLGTTTLEIQNVRNRVSQDPNAANGGHISRSCMRAT